MRRTQTGLEGLVPLETAGLRRFTGQSTKAVPGTGTPKDSYAAGFVRFAAKPLSPRDHGVYVAAARELAKERLISKAPSAKRLNQWLDLLAEYLESIPYRQAQDCRDSITRMCVTAAGQSGVGLLGMFERTSRAEKQVMRDLTERLDLEKGHEACQFYPGDHLPDTQNAEWLRLQTVYTF